MPRPSAALGLCGSRVRFRPQDPDLARDLDPIAGGWDRDGCYLGDSGSGEAVEALGRLEGIRQDIIGRSERSTSPDPRSPWTHHLHPGVAGGGGGHGWGAVGRHEGGLSGFGAPRAKIGYPSMFLTIGCGRHISGPHRIWAEVGSQGVPQTGKIIAVKSRLSGSFFSISEGLAVLFGVEWLDRMSQKRWWSSPTWPKASSNFFVHYIK